MTTTTTTELIAPYAATLNTIQERAHGRVTLAEALVRCEAAHVAEVRNARRAPENGWKNTFPLEHATLTGRHIRGMRIGDVQATRDAMQNPEQRDIARTLLNAENVFVDGYNWRKLSTDQLIEQASVDLYHC